MLLYYIRHGDPIYQPNSLTELGKEQAKAVAKRLAQSGIDEIYSSPSERAVMTAEPTAKLLGKEINLVDCFDEKYAWRYFTVVSQDGKKHWLYIDEKSNEILNSKEVYDLHDRWYEHPYFDKRARDGVEFFDKNFDEFFKTLGFEHDRQNRRFNVLFPNEKKIAVFAHSGVSRNLLSYLSGVPYPQIATRFTMTHSSVSVFWLPTNHETVIPRTLMWSNDSHIYKENLPTKYNNEFFI